MLSLNHFEVVSAESNLYLFWIRLKLVGGSADHGRLAAEATARADAKPRRPQDVRYVNQTITFLLFSIAKKCIFSEKVNCSFENCVFQQSFQNYAKCMLCLKVEILKS